MRRRSWWIPILSSVGWLLTCLIIAAWPGRSTFTVSPETTYITEPLDKHGYVDYVTALNQRLSEGVTPANNANVLIWQALGPRPEGTPPPDEYFRWFGTQPPPDDGVYFVAWWAYVTELAKTGKSIGKYPYEDRITELAERRWSAKESPEVADWLQRNEKPIARALEAFRRPKYYNPLVPPRTEDWSPGLLGALLPSVQRCREVAIALACRAMLHVNDNKREDAWRDLLASHRLGRLVAQGATQLELLVGLAVDQVADQADLVFLDQARLTSHQASACLRDLQKLPPMPPFANKLDLSERFILLDAITMTARYGTRYLEDFTRSDNVRQEDDFQAKLFTRSINWDPALRNANRWMNRWVAAARISERSARVQEMALLIDEIKQFKREVDDAGMFQRQLMGPERRGEMFGKIFIVMTSPSFDRVQDAADRCEQAQRNVRIAFALAAYRKDHGRYPTELEELAPRYLAKVPDDLFSDRPLHYHPEQSGYLLYSVGPNEIDEQGRGFDDEPRGDDLAVRMPLPRPRGER
jgi:hypothetical protein